jgi:hypothetical protein
LFIFRIDHHGEGFDDPSVPRGFVVAVW